MWYLIAFSIIIGLAIALFIAAKKFGEKNQRTF